MGVFELTHSPWFWQVVLFRIDPRGSGPSLRVVLDRHLRLGVALVSDWRNLRLLWISRVQILVVRRENRRGLNSLCRRVPDEFMQLQAQPHRQAFGEHPLD